MALIPSLRGKLVSVKSIEDQCYKTEFVLENVTDERPYDGNLQYEKIVARTCANFDEINKYLNERVICYAYPSGSFWHVEVYGPVQEGFDFFKNDPLSRQN